MSAVSRERLAGRIATLARFGALPGGGVTRPAWSPAHEEARAWLVAEMRAAGLTAWGDAAGNVFGALGLSAFRADAPAVVNEVEGDRDGGVGDGRLAGPLGVRDLEREGRRCVAADRDVDLARPDDRAALPL